MWNDIQVVIKIIIISIIIIGGIAATPSILIWIVNKFQKDKDK